MGLFAARGVVASNSVRLNGDGQAKFVLQDKDSRFHVLTTCATQYQMAQQLKPGEPVFVIGQIKTDRRGDGITILPRLMLRQVTEEQILDVTGQVLVAHLSYQK